MSDATHRLDRDFMLENVNSYILKLCLAFLQCASVQELIGVNKGDTVAKLVDGPSIVLQCASFMAIYPSFVIVKYSNLCT